MDIPRDWIEQRLFYAYCVKHSAYEEGTPERKQFELKAKEVMLEPPPLDIPKEKLAREELKTRVLFTKASIKRMDIKAVDAYLAVLGITVTDQPPKVRRYVLWEFYNKRASDLIKLRSNRNSRKLAKRPVSEIDNKFILADIILAFPKMGWPEFQETFAELMPKVTMRSFYNARCSLRKNYPNMLPRLTAGRRGARVNPLSHHHKGRVPAEKPDPSVLDDAEEFD